MMALTSSPLLQTFAACTKSTLFGLVPWYQYLTLSPNAANGGCTIAQFQNPTANNILGAHSPFFLIALAILDDLIRIAALIAVGYVIYGGIQYATSQGNPSSTQKARETITNALIGVAIAILAASMVGFLGNSLGSNGQ